MADRFDFEQAWLAKFSQCLGKYTGDETRKIVMEGSESLTDRSDSQEVIRWTLGAMERLEANVEKDILKSVMTGCACQYPISDLRDLRKEYEARGYINLVHRMLQERFEIFLRDTLALEEEFVLQVVQKGWGLAGILSDDRIIATKIPKSGFLVQYLKETDSGKRRQIYCHCPRVRDAVALSERLPATYCYCGAGFYKGIWEEILQKPVEVEVLESVLAGDEVCKVAIHLPEDC